MANLVRPETIGVQGARVHVADRGAGTPVLFLHGNPDTSEMWDGVVAHMQARHRCLAPDLPAFGRSHAPANFDCSLEGQARWVDDVVGALGLSQPVDLVVHDFGGLFGLAWAAAHPTKVRRLAILNTVFFPDYRWHFWARVWRTPLLGELSFLLKTRRGLELELRRGSKGLPRAYARRAYDTLTPETTRMVLKLYRAADPERFARWQDPLARLLAHTPAIVLWGDRDPYIDKRFAERFGAAEVHRFADAGHWLAVERPDVVAQRLLAFLA